MPPSQQSGPSEQSAAPPAKPTPREIARELSATMRCNCDLDTWEPERSTGHSWVCRIHKATMAQVEATARRATQAEAAR